MTSSPHTLKEFPGGRIACSKCLNGYNKNDPAVRPWLLSKCQLVQLSDTRPQSRPTSEPTHVGNQMIHCTHLIRQFRGFIYCKKCGNRAVSKMNNLAKSCSPPIYFGKATLRALSQGLLPPNTTQWPSDALWFNSQARSSNA